MATKIKRAILYIALIILGLMCLLPFWLMMVNSTRSGVEITHSFSFLPGHSLKDNWKDLIDSYIPLIIPAIASPGIVFFLRQYTKATLSKSLMEAARIDGASEIHIFHRIVLPIMAPGIATMSIGTFIGNWNSYLVPLILLNTPKKMTLPVMISTLNAATDLQKNQGAIYLGVAISVVPIIIAFCFFSKYIISSISAGSVKE